MERETTPTLPPTPGGDAPLAERFEAVRTPGPVGEYNGKFMPGQMVLRGGCSVTSRSHVRATYCNFFPPEARWPFTGVRLARWT